MEGRKPSGVLYSGSGARVGQVCREIKDAQFLGLHRLKLDKSFQGHIRIMMKICTKHYRRTKKGGRPGCPEKFS